MRKICYFLKDYKFDIIAAILNLISISIAFVYYPDNNKIFLLSSLIILTSFFIILYLRTREKDFYFIALTRRRDKDDWIGRGEFEYFRSEGSFYITRSGAGYIYSKSLNWSNYLFSFDFKIVNRYLGWIVRAINLSNYVMLQCGYDGINPHIKVNSLWFKKAHGDPDINLTYNEPLSKDKWYTGKLYCEKRVIKIMILEDNIVIFERQWIIPLAQVFEFKKKENVQTQKMFLPIDLDYGTIGFRCWGDERGLIKNILIEKI